MEDRKEKKEKRRNSRRRKLIGWLLLTVAILGIALAGVVWYYRSNQEPPQKEIITKATLEKILNISELSTFEAVYNGVARVMNPSNPQNIDYYVSYNARVKIGFDFEKISIRVKNADKHIRITIPPVTITDVIVDIGSLDYIFVNDKANTEMVSQQAYKACEEDVTKESKTQKDIFVLAQQNAENFVRALVKPFVEQIDGEYTIEIRVEG